MVIKFNLVVVYMNPNPLQPIPIVHRALQIFYKQENGSQVMSMLTKGDNNNVDDRGLYQGPLFLNRHHMIGYVKGNIPHLGMITIYLNEVPHLKNIVIGFLCMWTLFSKE